MTGSLTALLDELCPREGRFNGPVFSPEHDAKRLTGQIERVYAVMIGGEWLTLAEIEAMTGDPQASISAQIRHLRKLRFGAFTIEKRARGEHCNGLWEYQLSTSKKRTETT